MKLSGTSYLLTSSGVRERSYDSATGGTFWLFCDAIESAHEHESSTLLIELIERSIQLSLGGTLPDEISVTSALEHANRQIIEHFGGSRPMAFSLLLIARCSPCKETGAEELLFAGVGDMRVYEALGTSLSLLFCHPQARSLPSTLSAEERYDRLSSALGAATPLHVHMRRLPQQTVHRYLITSYGVYEQSSEEELLAMALYPSDLDKGIASKLHVIPQKGHHLQASALVCDALDQPFSAIMPKDYPLQTKTTAPLGVSRRRTTTLALTSAAAVFLILLATQWHEAPHTDITSGHRETLEFTVAQDLAERITPAHTREEAATHNDAKDQPPALGYNMAHDARVDALEQQLANAQEREQALLAQISALLTTMPTSPELMVSWSAEKDALQEEVYELRSINAQHHGWLTLEVENRQTLERELSEKNKQLQDLQLSLASIQGNAGVAIADLEQQIHTLLEGQTSLMSEHEAKYSALVSEMEARHSSLVAEMEARHHSLIEREATLAAQWEAEQQQQRQEYERLAASYSQLQAEREGHLRELATAKEYATQTHERLTQSLLSYQKARQDYASLERDVQNERAEIQRLRQTLAMTQQLREESNQRYADGAKVLQTYKDKYEQEHALRIEKEGVLVALQRELQSGKKSVTPPSQKAQAVVSVAAEPAAAMEGIKGGAYKRTHQVSKGETLSTISQHYYGTPNFWKVIYEANKETISDVNRLRVGTTLGIPE